MPTPAPLTIIVAAERRLMPRLTGLPPWFAVAAVGRGASLPSGPKAGGGTRRLDAAW